MKAAMINVFGFLWTQPVHQTLVNMRVVQITALYITYIWADALMTRILELSPDEANLTLLGIYFSNFATLVAVFWKAVNDIRKGA